ncbi:MAG: hypothetical protein H0T42_18700 [Deltaproteobacteria bacterium]|nr:hypothetical protein [Deltaproteobacteria bacterium]
MRTARVLVAILALTGCTSSATRPTAPTFAATDGLEEDDQNDGLDLDDHRDPLDGRDDQQDQLAARLEKAPHVADVLAAAYAAAGLTGRLPGHVAMRARLGGLVPWVSVRTGRDTSWHDEDPDVGRGTTLEVRATWRLDRLVFDGRELQVVALEAARRRERRRLATHVIRTYFAWKRSASRSHSAEAGAELDALTAGWFSEALRRTASEVRTVAPGAATP